MPCPHCAATATVEQRRRTALGYPTFRCPACRRAFNERTGTPYNHLQYPTDVVLLVVLWRLRHKLRLRDLAEMFLARGFVFAHETVRDWAARFAPLLAARLRSKRRGRTGTSWHADETYGKVNGTWCYRYRRKSAFSATSAGLLRARSTRVPTAGGATSGRVAVIIRRRRRGKAARPVPIRWCSKRAGIVGSSFAYSARWGRRSV